MARGSDGRWQTLTWDEAIARLGAKVKEARGTGAVFVTGLETGSFGELVGSWMKEAGGRHLTYEPFAFEALREGNRIAFGTSAIPWYDFAGARYIVSFGADFMETWLSPVGYQNAFTRAHAFQGGRDSPPARFVHVGPRLSLTGMSADEWLAAAPGTEGILALAMAHVILNERLGPPPSPPSRVPASRIPAAGADRRSRGRRGEGDPAGRARVRGLAGRARRGGGHGGAISERRRHRGGRECPELRRRPGRQDGQVRAQPLARGRRVVQSDGRPRCRDEGGQGRRASRARREPRLLARGRVRAGARQSRLQGQLLGLPR